MIAALYVQDKGAYVGHDDIDAWPESRDARLYAGPYPVVAHPPCARWCRLAGFVEKVYGHKRGDDGGCFERALAFVRTFFGVLEHPAHSKAWDHFGLQKPVAGAGWTKPDTFGGRSCHVEQRHYGHRATKATWLYAVGTDFTELQWGKAPPPELVVGSCSANGDGTFRRAVERMGKAERNRTPPEFKAVLLDLARSVYRAREAA